MNKNALQIEFHRWLQLIIVRWLCVCVYCVPDAKRDGMTATTIEKSSSLESERN